MRFVLRIRNRGKKLTVAQDGFAAGEFVQEHLCSRASEITDK